MVAELQYFSAMVFYGVIASFCYHLLLFLRAAIRHGVSLVDAEDILFLAAAGFGFFLTAYEKNNGILRWYAFAGSGLGCIAYLRTMGASLERVRKWLLQKRRKTYKIRAEHSKGQVSPNEGSSPEHGNKRKKKKRS